MYNRLIFNKIYSHLIEDRNLIQVLAGPRQVGKTTLAHQLLKTLPMPGYYASADSAIAASTVWIEQQWQIARLKLAQSSAQTGLLVLDEIQKIPQWSSEVKRLWDEDTASQISLQVLLLGSTQLLLQQGLTESLAGRFEVIPITHWSFKEMHEAFHCSLSEYIYFGGYPGAYALHDDEQRWINYVNDALIETTVSRDILQMSRIEKPALLRRLFDLSCHYSGQILSYQKMTGQLQDAGNTTTLAHYLRLLESAGLVCGIEKFAGQTVRQRASSPKLQVFNTALLSANSRLFFSDVYQNSDLWGRWVESTIGAHLLNSALGTGMKVTYWRDANYEVDFVLEYRGKIIALEVKSGRTPEHLPGIAEFKRQFNPDKCLLVGGKDGIPLETLLQLEPELLF